MTYEVAYNWSKAQNKTPTTAAVQADTIESSSIEMHFSIWVDSDQPTLSEFQHITHST